MITVHHLNNSRSQRILWLLEELDLSYEIKAYQRGPDLLAPPELLAVHPLGKSPVVTLTLDGRERTLAESAAIIDSLVEAYGRDRLGPPVDVEARLAYTYFMYASEGSFMTPLLLKLVTEAIAQRVPLLGNRIASGLNKALVTPNIQRHMACWEDTLSRHAWFAGERFTAADIMMSFPLEAASHRSGASQRPYIRAWLDTIHARPAYQRALARGGPYAYAT